MSVGGKSYAKALLDRVVESTGQSSACFRAAADGISFFFRLTTSLRHLSRLYSCF